MLAAARVLARRGLVAPPPLSGGGGADAPRQRNGVPLLPWMPNGTPVDFDLVNRLRDDVP